MPPRLPAEWEAQDAILLAWPDAQTDWASDLDAVRRTYTEILRAVTRFENVLLAARQPDEAKDALAGMGVATGRVRIHRVDYNDTWTRDYGPITVLEEGQPVLLDFTFNGWGKKFTACEDDLVTRRLREAKAFGRTPLRTVELVLEGGAIESDGRGTLVTTSRCLLEPNRNPLRTRDQIERSLVDAMGARRVLWLDHGHLVGDDTDSHIDTLARLCPDDAILYTACDDPSDEHYEDLSAMADELRAFRTAGGEPYRLIPLPWPDAQFDDQGHRLPATYANFLIINGAVLAPTYGDPERDETAMRAIGSSLPGRVVIGIDCRPLIRQHGSLHCVTMQLPRGVLGTANAGECQECQRMPETADAGDAASR